MRTLSCHSHARSSFDVAQRRSSGGEMRYILTFPDS
jgi:hypothetical protein